MYHVFLYSVLSASNWVLDAGLLLCMLLSALNPILLNNSDLYQDGCQMLHVFMRNSPSDIQQNKYPTFKVVISGKYKNLNKITKI